MLRVLIAKDEEMIRERLIYTTDWLSMGCVMVARAADDRGGYEKILECRPDVVIADIYMPFMDGVEMIREASEQVRFKNILLTSYADFEYARRAIEAGVCKYLLKPANEETLADTMERLGEEVVSSHQVEHAMRQAEIERGNLNLECYMQLDLPKSQYVSRVIKAIQGDFTRGLSIRSISDDLRVNASRLSRKFREITGQTFLDFLNKYRVRQAIVVLGTRQYRISEISEATGFTDCKHFYSVFKKYTPKSPAKFIRGVS